MKRRHLRPDAPQECRIVVRNDILGTVVVKHSPQSARNALRNDGDIALAKEWIDYEEMAEDGEPITVAVRCNEHVIVVHWHLMADPEPAHARMQAVLSGGRSAIWGRDCDGRGCV